MFSGIDLNLNPLDDDDKMREIKALDLCLDDACRRIIEMAGNQCSAQQMLVMVSSSVVLVSQLGIDFLGGNSRC